MIELRNIRKIYKSKNSSDTIAVNDINLNIGNSGMLFIVGKSGSGKSTLLNLIGGLDAPTSGDIIVDGKIINNFKKREYDCYRNSYIGFVFQEFNILEQYNVYENIEISIKLQKKAIDRKNIDLLMNKLGINDLGDRRTNELSGGQKQRVAIARALIKEPKIILADEPTGNLDSASSIQIFEILKEISKDRLVIVVSHDTTSAQKYGDMIVSIEDGKIIEEKGQLNSNNNKEFNLKKSSLPFLYAFKMAFNNFKFKPFKLIMTILLTTMSLIFMGITINSMLFEPERLQAQVMDENEDYFYNVYNIEYKENGFSRSLELTSNDEYKISKFTGSIINPVYTLYDNNIPLSFEYGELEDNELFEFTPLSNLFIEIKDDNIIQKVIGKNPSNEYEIVIHKYLADYIIEAGIITSNNELFKPKSYNEIVSSNMKIKLGDNNVIIVGIIDDDDSLYKGIKQTKSFPNEKIKNYYYENYVYNYNYIYVKGFTKVAKLNQNKELMFENLYIRINNAIASNIEPLNKNINIVNSNGEKDINLIDTNQLVLSFNTFKEIYSTFEDELNDYLMKNNDGIYKDLLVKFTSKYIKNNDVFSKLNAILSSPNYKSSSIKLDVIGITFDDINYVNNNIIKNYELKKSYVSFVRIYDNDVKNLRKVFKQYKLQDTISERGILYTSAINHGFDVSNIINVNRFLYKYIFIVSLVFLLFNILLFSNFISVSISYCKKEIGIIRAIGASSKDVIKIFVYESILIAVISWILSIIGWFICINLINESFFGNLYYKLNVIITHPFVPFGMFIYTILISILITIISMSKVASVKPIDAILNK